MAKVRTLLLNMQHLLNSLRPYQAREELIASVQVQVDAKEELIDSLKRRVAACASAADGELDSADAAVAGGGVAETAASSSNDDVALSSEPFGSAEDAERASRRAREQLEGLL